MYGNFKSINRATRRGHVATLTTNWAGDILFRPVKSDKAGKLRKEQSGKASHRHNPLAFFNSSLSANGQKTCRL